MNEDINKAVFTTSQVLKGSSIVRVFHDNDGDWQFFSTDEEITENNAKVISLSEVLQIEPSLKIVIKTLPKGFEAYREKGNQNWFIKYDDGQIKNLN